MSQKLRLYKDAVGRTLLGEIIEEKSDANIVTVKNPLLIHMGVNANSGQIAINFFPEVFKEFQADKEEDSFWSYPRTSVALCNEIVLDVKLISQYANVFSKGGSPKVETPVTPAVPTTGRIIKLFDDK